jgi:WD40 repeat protein
MPQQQQEAQVPSAPYPPMHARPAPKSSLSSSPHYSTSYVARNADSINNSGSVMSSINSIPTSAEAGEENLGGIRQTFSEPHKNGRATSTHSSQIRFCPYWSDTIACINCVTATSPRGELTTGEAGRNRKLGPILLELRQLELAQKMGIDDQAKFFTTGTIALSRGNPQLGTSVSSTCLDLPTVQTYSGQSEAPVAAATGLTTGMLCIHTFGKDFDEDGLLSSSIEYYHTPRHHRQASAVAWKPNNANHVAIGLLGSSSASGPQQGSGPRRGTNIRAGGDREFCCFLWDIEAQQSANKRNALPVSKLSHNAPVASLAWVLDGQTLAVGSQSRNIQLYDMRVSTNNVPPISAHAHSFGVHGIEVDPNKPVGCVRFQCQL